MEAEIIGTRMSKSGAAAFKLRFKDRENMSVEDLYRLRLTLKDYSYSGHCTGSVYHALKEEIEVCIIQKLEKYSGT